jgi:DNA-directed RNA polymerase subunit RPC12/RpoP
MAEKLIAIKGFQMPYNCIECPLQFGGWCGASPPEIDERVAETVDEAVRQKKPKWCPLVEVKPVERSRWLSRQRNGYKIYECAHCGKHV